MNKKGFDNQVEVSVDKTAKLFDFYPEKLKELRPDLKGNLHDLITVLLKSGATIKELKVETKVPSFGDWNTEIEFLRQFEKDITKAFEVASIADSEFIGLNSMIFSEPEVILILEKRLREMSLTLDNINEIQDSFKLNETFDQFVKLALTASILNMVDKVQIDLLNNESKKYKQFNTWSKKYQLLKAKVQQAELANNKWTKKPSLSEITELLDLLSAAERRPARSVLAMLRRNPAKLKTSFQDFHSGIANHTKIKLLESVQLEWRLKAELDEVVIKLKHNLNINDPDNEIDLVFNLRNKLNAVSQNEYIRILEDEKSRDLIQALSKVHPDIQKFNAQNRFLFQDYQVQSIRDFQNRLEKLKGQLPQFNHWLPELKSFFKLSVDIRNFVRLNSKKIDQLTAVVAYQNLLDETRFEPTFKALSGWDLMKESTNLNQNKMLSFKANTKNILNFSRQNQQLAEDLLAKPSFKLKEDQKFAKRRYKKEKRLVLHEVNKQQRHLAVKTFFEETRTHLLKMQPVWVMNPLTVSENLPCDKDLFDVVIFDESSQIPLEDAIPAIYRSKQVVVVGDSKQMPPSAFFSSSAETVTLLDQSERVFRNQMLKWHYRSQHPDLIRFSNIEFYNGELFTFPPRTLEQPIEIKHIAGNYQGGKNEIEAKEIAVYCQNHIKNESKEILIIAFSQEQEKEIRRQLNKLELLDHHQITTRNLENAQGIEAEIVLVSIGYGKNEEGDFRLNFGPVNQVNGANRLNVLFTRAIEKMIVFTSVRSVDFGLSENRGVQVLKDFLSYAEGLNQSDYSQEKLPLADQLVEKILSDIKADYKHYPAGDGIGFGSYIQHEKGIILLVDPGVGEDDPSDVASLLAMLSNHYKKVEVVLSLDLWTNFERVSSNLKALFCGN